MTALFPTMALALCNPATEVCLGYERKGNSAPAYPSRGSSIRINPSAVPTEDGFGVETIMFKNQFDFSLVKGTGRVGAAISPTNGEETFFGPPGFELDPDLLKRRRDQDKYSSQKIALATAFSLFKNRRDGLEKVELNLGVVAKYNRLSQGVWPGVGLSAVGGPIKFGYAVGKDEQVIDETSLGLDQKLNLRYMNETYSFGLYLNSLAIDYSIMRLFPDGLDTMTVNLLTASVFVKSAILTAALRTEDSTRPAFDEETRTLIQKQIKQEVFAGAQLTATKTIMFGCFYNYYAMREFSLGLTLFL